MKLKSMTSSPSYVTRAPYISSFKTQVGFTLIEFIVAAVLGLMVILAIGGAYVATQRVNETAASRVDRQQDLRLASNLLVRDARMAGTFGCANLSVLGTGGLSQDHGGSSAFNINNHAGYFNVNESVGNSRVFATRIVAGDSSIINGSAGVAPSFQVTAGSDAVIFHYGANTQPILTTSINAPNTLTNFTVADSTSFRTASNNAKMVLASCNRIDVLTGTQLGFATGNQTGNLSAMNIPMYKAGVNVNAIVNQTGAIPGMGHYASQATLSNLYTVVYMTGKVAGDSQADALYRFESQADGTWSPPQLLARNVSDLEAEYIYINDCKVSAAASSASSTVNERYFVSQEPFLEKTDADSVVQTLTPSGIQMKLTPSEVKTDSEDTAVTTETDLQVLVLNAAMRGADACTLNF